MSPKEVQNTVRDPRNANPPFNMETIEKSRSKHEIDVVAKTGKHKLTPVNKDNQDESNMELSETGPDIVEVSEPISTDNTLINDIEDNKTPEEPYFPLPDTVEASEHGVDKESPDTEFKSLEAAVGSLLVSREVDNCIDGLPKLTPKKKKSRKRKEASTPVIVPVPVPVNAKTLPVNLKRVFINPLAVERELIELRKHRQILPRAVVEDWHEDRKCNGREETWRKAQPDQVLALVRICINICDVRSECMKDDRKLGGQSGIVAGHNLVQRLDYYDSIKKEDKSTIDALDSFKPGTAVNL